jgi:hypothetical protein
MHYTTGDGTGKSKDRITSSNATLLWKSNKPPPNLTRYNLSSFAITLNELTPGLQVVMIYHIDFLVTISLFHVCISNCFL